MILSIFFGIFSLIVVVSEVTLFIQVDVSVFGNLIKLCQGFVESEVKLNKLCLIYNIKHRFLL